MAHKTKKTAPKRKTVNGTAPGGGWKKNQNLLALACVAAALIVGLIVVHYVKVIEDKRRFDFAENRFSYVTSNFYKYTGVTSSVNRFNECTDTSEQYLHSATVCTINTNIIYKVNDLNTAKSVQQKATNLLKSSGAFGKYLDPNDDATFNFPSKNLNCEWGFSPDYSGANSLKGSKIDLQISCSGDSEPIYEGN